MDPTHGPLTPRVKRAFIAVLVCFFNITLINLGFASAVDAKLLRSWFVLRGPREVPQSVSIVRYEKYSQHAHHETTKATGETKPLRQLASVIDAISAGGAKLIVLDILFNQQNREDEKVLARSLAAAPSVIGMVSSDIIESDGQGGLHERKVVIGPTPLLVKNVLEVLNLKVENNNNVVQSLVLHEKTDGDTSISVPLLRPLRRFVSARVREPESNARINYYGPHLGIANVSMAEAVSSKAVAKKCFKNRVVFIGEHGLQPPQLGKGHDTHLTSVSTEPMFGVEIHATIAANLLDNSWVRQPSLELEALATNLCIGLLAFFTLALSLLRGAAITGICTSVWLGFSYYSLTMHNYFVPGLSGFGVVMPLVLISRWVYIHAVRMFRTLSS